MSSPTGTQRGTPRNRLDRIEQAIEGLNSAMNMMLTEFIRPLVQQSQVNQQALDGLIEMTASAEVDRSEQNQRIENLLNDAIADRQRSDQRFEQQMAEIRALGEQNRALLSALAHTNGRVDDLEQAS
jgi:hypothetical protein